MLEPLREEEEELLERLRLWPLLMLLPQLPSLVMCWREMGDCDGRKSLCRL